MSDPSSIELPGSFAGKSAAFDALHACTPSHLFARNIRVTIETINMCGVNVPVTINSADPINSWVTSPITTYSRYAMEEATRYLPVPMRPFASASSKLLTAYLGRAHLDDAVSINNWLLSTNMYPQQVSIDADSMVEEIVDRWPTKSIWLRSLNVVQHRAWIDALGAAGFDLIPSRQVYLFDDWNMKKSTDFRRDMNLLKKTPLGFVHHQDFSKEDFVVAERLYSQLYLDRYSTLNPQYTHRFLSAWHAAGLLRFGGFRDEHCRLIAVVGLFDMASERTCTAPIVGYDTSLDPRMGLYRLLMAHTLRESMSRGQVLNLSAGAAHFKRLRGGKPVIEYSAVYSRHLPSRSTGAIKLLRAITTRIGIPIMERFKL